MKIEEVERILGITRQTVYQHVRRNNLNPIKIGGRLDFDGQEVYKFLLKRSASAWRYSPSNEPPKAIASNREFSAHHIWDLVRKLERFQLRYEHQKQYTPLFEFKEMLSSVFAETPNPEDLIAGKEINEVLMYIEIRIESVFQEEKELWRVFQEKMTTAFLEMNDDFNRSELFEDMILDAVIELTTRHSF